jgi:hypothetical protein
MRKIIFVCSLFLSGSVSAQTPTPPSTAAAPSAPLLELEPLIITAPRLKLPPNAILDPQINANLLRLLQLPNMRPNSQEQLDPSLTNLANLTTLDGYNLQTRYTQLGFLLTEGLAGTKDLTLQNSLQTIVQTGTNVQIQALALDALAYTHDPQFIPLFQSALQNTNVTIRFTAMEALYIMANGQPNSNISSIIYTAAEMDASLAVKLYASHLAWKLGNEFGRETLLHHYQDPDWFTRAFSTHYLGEMGKNDVYSLIQPQLYSETNPSVQAELCWALLKMEGYRKP